MPYFDPARYNKTPTNGLVLYVGTVLNEEGKERKATFAQRTSLISLKCSITSITIES